MTAVLDVIEPPVPKVYEKEYSLFNKEKGYIWLGSKKAGTCYILTPHPKGLLLFSKSNKYQVTKETLYDDEEGVNYDSFKTVNTGKIKTKRVIIPGNYTKAEVVTFLIKTCFGLSPSQKSGTKGRSAAWRKVKDINKALTESGYWKARGKINWPDCPKGFWEWCPLSLFVVGRTASYKAWWKQISYLRVHRLSSKHLSIKGSNVFKNYTPIVEKPNCVKNWNKLSGPSFCSLVKYRGHRDWGRFTSLVYPTFNEVLRKHKNREMTSSLLSGPLALTDYLAGASKHPKFVENLDLVLNSGLGWHHLYKLQPKNLEQINQVLEFMKEYNKVKTASPRVITSDYKPPEVELPEGWAWANHETFYELSNMYANCISNSSHYEKWIREGRAHVAYRTDKKDRGGCVCFFELEPLASSDESYKWMIGESRGYANSNPDRGFTDDLAALCSGLWKVQPKPNEPLKEQPQMPIIMKEKLTPLQQKLYEILNPGHNITPALDF